MAFASGARHNDISEQMRNVARQITRAEVQAAVRYYGPALVCQYIFVTFRTGDVDSVMRLI
jgi:hypothetical protein